MADEAFSDLTELLQSDTNSSDLICISDVSEGLSKKMTIAEARSLFGGAQASEVLVETSNGYGSTNTKIKRFTTTTINDGSDITYADSATDGASFTINTAGCYAVLHANVANAAAVVGVSKNSNQLTTNINSITIEDMAAISNTQVNANEFCSASNVVKCAAGDVIRPHTQGDGTGFASQEFFRISGPF